MKNILRILALALVMGLSACATTPPPVRLAIAQTDRGVVIWLPDNVLFEFGSSQLSPAADDYLKQVADLARNQTQEVLSLEGHTDNVGSADFNQALSLKRADAVVAALARLGVPAERLLAVGRGLSSPLAPNDTELGRKLNRRVEIVVLNETVAHLTTGMPENRFEDAFQRLKKELGDQVEARGFR